MTAQNDSRLVKLRSGIFQKTDIVEIDLCFERLLDKEVGSDKSKILLDGGLSISFETVLRAGPMWKFNPTCLDLFIHDNRFEYSSDKLVEEIKKSGNFTQYEVDKNLNLHKVSWTLRLLKINTHFIKDDVINDSSYVCVNTIMGKVDL